MILGSYRTGDANDPDIYVRAVAAVLGGYSLDVMKAVADPRHGIASKSKWLPTVAEIKEACEEQMAPVYRRQHLERLEKERRAALSAPPVQRMTREEMEAKYGPNWGLTPERESRKWQPIPLDQLCREAGISREAFEEINAKAEAAMRPFGTSR